MILRALAILGVVVVLLQEMVSAIPLEPRQEIGFVVLAVAVPVILIALAWLPSAWATLLRHPDLLVPLGILTLAEAVVGWLLLLPMIGALLSPTKQLQIAALTFTVSAGFVVLIVLNVVYSTWVSLLIVSAVREGHAEPARALARSWGWFFRVLGLEFIGWAVLFAGVAAALLLAPFALVLVFPAIGIGALLWNLATAALLPLALDGRLGFWEAFNTGIRVSWECKGRWWKPVVAQIILLGWVTWVHASYSETTPKGFAHREVSNWSVNGFWTGGFENTCRWYSEQMKALNAPKVQVISTALGLLFGVLAIAVKLTIVERTWGPETTFHDDDGLDPALEPSESADPDETYMPEDRWAG